MNHLIKITVILILLKCPSLGFAELNAYNYWECTTQDQFGNTWVSKNNYKKIAFNRSYEQCKKQSAVPTTCSISSGKCSHYMDGMNTTPMWECTAIDFKGDPWKSIPYESKEDAALAAKDFCKSKSEQPETCFINMITCMNINEPSTP